MRATGHDHQLLAKFPQERIRLGTLTDQSSLDHGIELFALEPADASLTQSEWSTWLDHFYGRGYRLVESEWHHARFTSAADRSAHSTVNIKLHVVNEQTNERLVVDGPLEVDWMTPSNGTAPLPAVIDASQLRLKRRVGDPAFRQVALFRSKRTAKSNFVGVYDLDRDGMPEILFNGSVWNRNGETEYTRESLRSYPRGPVSGGTVADLTGDGLADFVCTSASRKPQLYIADAVGRFSTRPGHIDAVASLKGYSTSLTAGDVNGDGLSDLWLRTVRSITVRFGA